ncbi:NUDIX hydrolase [Verrucomicrobiales bacterium]|jgi:ADP-ribose pyrophosphatase|nr:NUDIX hydrolase [Verrucomicrobiales bacterium]
MKPQPKDELLCPGKFVELRKTVPRGWEYAHRPNAKGAVAILALTDDKKVVITEQFRPPVDRYVIELPAGLAGDIPLQEDEPLETAARRELKEETGYEAKNWSTLGDGPSSAGLSTEHVTIFQATGLTKVSEGGGDATEDIAIHYVTMSDIPNWCADRQREGKMVDFKIFAALYLARSKSHLTAARLWF